MPRVHLQPYHQASAEWANAPVGVVQTVDITRRTRSFRGNFHINVNRYWLGRMPNAQMWSEVLTHEMMHNLGHLHGPDEYGTHLQINAVGRSVHLAALGRPGGTAPRDQLFDVEFPRFCGS
jgi:hypothetical protein